MDTVIGTTDITSATSVTIGVHTITDITGILTHNNSMGIPTIMSLLHFTMALPLV